MIKRYYLLILRWFYPLFIVGPQNGFSQLATYIGRRHKETFISSYGLALERTAAIPSVSHAHKTGVRICSKELDGNGFQQTFNQDKPNGFPPTKLSHFRTIKPNIGPTIQTIFLSVRTRCIFTFEKSCLKRAPGVGRAWAGSWPHQILSPNLVVTHTRCLVRWTTGLTLPSSHFM